MVEDGGKRQDSATDEPGGVHEAAGEHLECQEAAEGLCPSQVGWFRGLMETIYTLTRTLNNNCEKRIITSQKVVIDL